MSPLGIEAVGEGLVANYLLPGLTNATIYARYYSFMAWAVGTFTQSALNAGAPTKRRKNFDMCLGRLEHAWRLCSAFSSPNLAGIIGVSEARKTPLGTSRKVSLTVDAASAFEPQNYGASFRGLGFAQWGEQWILELSDIGRALHRAFDETLRFNLPKNARRALTKLLEIPETMESKDLEALAPRFRIRPVQPGESEFSPLLRALTHAGSHAQSDSLTHGDHARARGLGLLLEVYDQGEGSLHSPDNLLRVFATRALPDGRTLTTLPRGLEEAFNTWERYIERQYQKRVIGSLWHELLAYLANNEPHSVSTRQIVERLCNLTANSSEVQNRLACDLSTLSWNEIVSKSISLSPKKATAARIQMWDLASAVTGWAPAELSGEERLGKALHLLALLTVQLTKESADLSLFQRSLRKEGSAERLSISWFEHELARRGNDVGLEIIVWLVEWCVIAQANRVAFEKLAQGDRFFIRRDESGYRLGGSARGTDSHFFFDSNRLRGATSLLRELGLLTETGPIQLTTAGKRLKEELASLAPLSSLALTLDMTEDAEFYGDADDPREASVSG